MLASEFLIVLCSPRSAQSKWVNREVAFFKRRRDPKKILTLIIDGEPMASAMPGREADECFPKTLLYKVGEDLAPTDVAEDAPLAADARESGDGKRGAKLKLAAAMLGLGLDELVRRDERRRTARRRLALSASLALATVLGGLSIYAFNQRDAAVVARNEAVTAQKEAEAAERSAVKARDDAEGLIELILTDLKSDLESYGTLRSVTQIGNRAIGYYEGQDVKALTPDQLGRRARVVLMLGEADNKRGDLDSALARYETAAATTGEQLARDPDNAQRIFDHAQSVFWVGYIAWQRGDQAKAKTHFTQYHDYAQKLVAIDPANDDWQAELEYSYSNLGTLAMDEGEAAEAEGWFRKSLEVSSRLLEKHPEETERVVAAGESYAWLADALHRQMRLPEARISRLSEIALYRRSKSSPTTSNVIELRAISAHYRLAQIELSSGQLQNAIVAARIASDSALDLLERDPENSLLADRASLSLAILGETQFHQGDFEKARHALAKSHDIARRLADSDKTVVLWRAYNLANVRLIEARLDKSHPPEAFDSFVQTQRELMNLASDPSVIRVYCGMLAFRARSSLDAAAIWAEITAILTPDQDKHGPEALTLLVEAHMRLGEKSKAADIASSLFAAGFRHPDFMALLDEFPKLREAAEGRRH